MIKVNEIVFRKKVSGNKILIEAFKVLESFDPELNTECCKVLVCNELGNPFFVEFKELIIENDIGHSLNESLFEITKELINE